MKKKTIPASFVKDKNFDISPLRSGSLYCNWKKNINMDNYDQERIHYTRYCLKT